MPLSLIYNKAIVDKVTFINLVLINDVNPIFKIKLIITSFKFSPHFI